MQHLVIFDIDGTLTDTCGVDSVCFEVALAEEFAVGPIETNWSTYSHATDSFILDYVFHKAFGRRIRPQEVARFQKSFVEQLGRAYARQPDDFQEIAGARAAFLRLQTDPSYAVALGSGGWKASALFKLQGINIDATDIAGAFADDGLSREEIVQAAYRRASVNVAADDFASVIYGG